MSDTEKLLEACAGLAIAVEEISSEAPKLKKQFQECRQLEEGLLVQVDEKEKKIDAKVKRYEKKLNDLISMANKTVQKYDDISNAFGYAENFLQICRSYEEKITDLQMRLDIMTACLRRQSMKADSLCEIIALNDYRLPVTVVYDKWIDYRFTIMRVANGMAEGRLWKEYNGKEQTVKETQKYPLQNTGYRLYVKPERIFVPKKPAQNGQEDSFMYIPDDLDEELPFA